MSIETLEHFQARRKEAQWAGFQCGEQELLPTSPGRTAGCYVLGTARLSATLELLLPGRERKCEFVGNGRWNRQLEDFLLGLKWLASGTSPLEEGQKRHGPGLGLGRRLGF